MDKKNTSKLREKFDIAYQQAKTEYFKNQDEKPPFVLAAIEHLAKKGNLTEKMKKEATHISQSYQNTESEEEKKIYEMQGKAYLSAIRYCAKPLWMIEINRFFEQYLPTKKKNI
jgi:hypothetical protein